MEEDSFVLENIYIGDECISLYQLPSKTFNEACNNVNNNFEDNTGLRVYLGCFCCIQFLQKIKKFVMNKDVIELGCGSGALSLIGLRNLEPASITLTDGNQSAINLCKMNVELIKPLSNCQVLNLSWDESVENFGMKYNNNKKFDVIIGSDLMYYSTDVGQLLKIMLSLTNLNDGIFISAHVFRRSGQKQEMIDYLKMNDWTTIQVPIEYVASHIDLLQHPDWYSTCCLISSSTNNIAKILIENPSWLLFKEEDESEGVWNFNNYFE